MSEIKATDIFGKDAIIYAIRAQAEGIKTVVMHDFGNGILPRNTRRGGYYDTFS